MSIAEYLRSLLVVLESVQPKEKFASNSSEIGARSIDFIKLKIALSVERYDLAANACFHRVNRSR